MSASKKPLALLFFTLFNSILGLSVLFPILGPLGRALHLSELQIGSMSTGYALMQFLLSPFWGRLSEKHGRKPILLIGVVGFGIGFFLLGIAAQMGLNGALAGTPLFVSLLLSRVLGGALSSAMLPTAQASAADLSGVENRTKAMAVIGAAFGLAIVFGPAIGALVDHFFGLIAPIWFSVGLAIINFVLASLYLPETRRGQSVTVQKQRASASLFRRTLPLLILSLVVTVSSVGMEQTIAFLVQDRLHLFASETPRRVGIALVSYGFVAVLAQGFIVRKWRVPPQTLVQVGLPISLCGMLLLSFALTLPWMVVSLALQGLGSGLILPGVTSQLSLEAGEDEQGQIAGLNNSAQGLARLLGPLLGTSLYHLRAEYPYWVSSTLLAVSFAVVLLRRQRAPLIA